MAHKLLQIILHPNKVTENSEEICNLDDFFVFTQKKTRYETRSRTMGDKGGRKSKEKTQKQSSDKHKQIKRDKLEKQQRGQTLPNLISENIGGKK